jgi:hypothetical protein
MKSNLTKQLGHWRVSMQLTLWVGRKTAQGEKELTALAACTMVCYDLGYKMITGKFRLATWIKQIKTSVLNTSALNLFKSKHKVKQVKQTGWTQNTQLTSTISVAKLR